MTITLVIILSTCILHLVLISLMLRFQHKFITHGFQPCLVQFVVHAVIILTHARILALQELNMLGGGFLVVEETTDS